MKRSLKICLSIIFSIFMFASPIAIGFLWKNDLAIETSKTTYISPVPKLEEPQDISDAQTKEQKSGKVLPSDYVRVEYIKSTKQQVLNTEIYATKTTDVIMQLTFENEIAVVDNTVSNAFFGASDAVDHEVFGANFGGKAEERYSIYNWADVTYSQGEPVAQTRISASSLGKKISFQKRSGFTAIVDSSNVTATTSYEKMDIPIHLFGQERETGVYPFSRYDMYIYFCKIFDGGVIVRDFVPCKRTIDGIAGLYDFVSQEFFSSQTGVEFVAGSEVTTTNFRSYEDYFIDHDIAYTTVKDYIKGDGSANNPYVVSSTEAFMYIMNFDLFAVRLIEKYLEIDCDIFLNDERFDKNGNAIGGDGIVYLWGDPNRRHYAYQKTLSFNGNNHRIYGFCAIESDDVSGEFRSRLFHTNMRTIENVALENIYVYGGGYNYVSMLAYTATTLSNVTATSGYIIGNGDGTSVFVNTASYIYNCENNVEVHSYYQGASAFAYNLYREAKGCVNYANMYIYPNSKSTNGRGSGIVQNAAYDYTLIEGCVNYGDIDLFDKNEQGGGIVAWGRGTVKNCVNYGDVVGTAHIAGIVGLKPNVELTVVSCENYGKITLTGGGWHCGSIVGTLLSNAKQDLVIRDCYTILTKTQGLVGMTDGETSADYNPKITISDCRVDVFANDLSNVRCLFVAFNHKNLQLNISNVEVNILGTGIKSITLIWNKSSLEKDKLNIKNILINIADGNVKFKPSNHSNESNLAMNLNGIVVNQKDNMTYYGSDFSGFYCDWKTGKLGLKALSGKGFYQGTVTEQTLINKGYTKKTL